jgi:hypothetical protein
MAYKFKVEFQVIGDRVEVVNVEPPPPKTLKCAKKPISAGDPFLNKTIGLTNIDLSLLRLADDDPAAADPCIVHLGQLWCW